MINFLQIKKHFPEYHDNKSMWGFWYCFDIKDDPKAYNLITESQWAKFYCQYVTHRPEVAKYISITDEERLKLYKQFKFSQNQS